MTVHRIKTLKDKAFPTMAIEKTPGQGRLTPFKSSSLRRHRCFYHVNGYRRLGVILLDDIVLAPFKIVHWIGKKLYEHAEGELTDESAVRQELLELQMRFELDDITEDEYQEGEDALMARLKSIRDYKEERGLD